MSKKLKKLEVEVKEMGDEMNEVVSAYQKFIYSMDSLIMRMQMRAAGKR